MAIEIENPYRMVFACKRTHCSYMTTDLTSLYAHIGSQCECSDNWYASEHQPNPTKCEGCDDLTKDLAFEKLKSNIIKEVVLKRANINLDDIIYVSDNKLCVIGENGKVREHTLVKRKTTKRDEVSHTYKQHTVKEHNSKTTEVVIKTPIAPRKRTTSGSSITAPTTPIASTSLVTIQCTPISKQTEEVPIQSPPTTIAKAPAQQVTITPKTRTGRKIQNVIPTHSHEKNANPHQHVEPEKGEEDDITESTATVEELMVKYNQTQNISNYTLSMFKKDSELMPSDLLASIGLEDSTASSMSSSSYTLNNPAFRQAAFRTMKQEFPDAVELSEEDRLKKYEKYTKTEGRAAIGFLEAVLPDPDYNVKNIVMEFARLFDLISTNRKFTKYISELRIARRRLIGLVPIHHYEAIVSQHIKILTNLLETKGYTGKKLKQAVCEGLSALDAKLGSYGKYDDEVDRLDLFTFRFSIVGFYDPFWIKEYKPFNARQVYQKFMNKGLLYYTLRENIRELFFNAYGYNSIIYVPVQRSRDEDPYSFYTLSKIENGKRYWIQDCRLEDFAYNFVQTVKPYAIQLFRKVYRDIFGDNEFTSKYVNMNCTTIQELQMLLENIMYMSDHLNFVRYLQNEVMKYAHHYPTDNDRFNIIGDDLDQKRSFKENDFDYPDHISSLKQMFVISTEEAVDFYRTLRIY